mgnify:CR=1 FL=1
MAVQLSDNKVFINPSIGTELTVFFNKRSTDIDSDTAKYMPLICAKKVQIRSNKIFKITKIDGTLLTDASSSSSTAPTWSADLSGIASFMESISFEAEEASGEFEVLAFGGAK